MTQLILDEVCHVGGYSNKSNIELEFVPRLTAFGRGDVGQQSPCLVEWNHPDTGMFCHLRLRGVYVTDPLFRPGEQGVPPKP